MGLVRIATEKQGRLLSYRAMRRFVWLLIPVGLFAAVLVYDVVCASQVTLPPDVTTLDTYLAWQPGDHTGVIRHRGDAEYLVVFGPLVGFVSSGPAAYVFDKSGRLVDWTVDSGDSFSFQQKWNPPGVRVEVDSNYAGQWVEEQ